jgi:hypothetical protein
LQKRFATACEYKIASRARAERTRCFVGGERYGNVLPDFVAVCVYRRQILRDRALGNFCRAGY